MDDAASMRTWSWWTVRKADKANVEGMGGKMGSHEEGERAQGRGLRSTRDSTGQVCKREGGARHPFACSASAQGSQREGPELRWAVV